MSKAVDIPNDCYDIADHLTPYGIAARYPSNLYFDEYNTQRAIDAAAHLLTWVKRQVPEA